MHTSAVDGKQRKEEKLLRTDSEKIAPGKPRIFSCLSVNMNIKEYGVESGDLGSSKRENWCVMEHISQQGF